MEATKQEHKPDFIPCLQCGMLILRNKQRCPSCGKFHPFIKDGDMEADLNPMGELKAEGGKCFRMVQMEDEELRELLAIALDCLVTCGKTKYNCGHPDCPHLNAYQPSYNWADQILPLIREAGGIDPTMMIMPGEFGTPKAKEILAQWAEANGYLPVEPVQLEVLSEEEMKKVIKENLSLLNNTEKAVELLFKISRATITHNEKKGQLYRRVE